MKIKQTLSEEFIEEENDIIDAQNYKQEKNHVMWEKSPCEVFQ